MSICSSWQEDGWVLVPACITILHTVCGSLVEEGWVATSIQCVGHWLRKGGWLHLYSVWVIG